MRMEVVTKESTFRTLTNLQDFHYELRALLPKSLWEPVMRVRFFNSNFDAGLYTLVFSNLIKAISESICNGLCSCSNKVLRVDPQSSAKRWKKWIHKVVLVTKVSRVKLLGCSAGFPIPERCPNWDVGTVQKTPGCSVSLLIPGNWPNSDVGLFQKTSRMFGKFLNIQ